MSNSNPVTVNRLAAFKGHVTRAVRACDEELGAFSPSCANLEFKCESLIKAFTKYQEAFLLFEEQQDATGDSYDGANSSYQSTETSYNDARTKVQSKIQSLKNTQSPGLPTGTTLTNVKPKIKLRPIELPTFSGTRRDWPPFWESFKSLVHDNTDYENVVKFTYLRQSLKGEAAKQIGGFSGVGTDYTQAIAILTKLYADKRGIRYDIIDKLASLKAPKCNKEELLEFHTSYTTLLRQLEGYVDDIKSAEWATEVMIQRKLPPNFCKFLYDRYHENFFTEVQISDGILDFAQRFENACIIDSVSNQPSMGKTQKSLSTPTVAVHNVTVGKKCIFCSSSHSSRHCSQYPTVNDRRTRLEALGRCKRCCATNHSSSECKIGTFNSCITCHKTNHHGYLCFQLEPQSSNVNANTVSFIESVTPTRTKRNSHKNASRNTSQKGKVSKPEKPEKPKPEVTQSEPSESVPATVSSMRTIHNQNISETPQTQGSTALPTALVTVQSQNEDPPYKARCFFDQGSQLSFVSLNLQRKLNLKPVSKVSVEIHHGLNDVTSAREFDVVKPIVSLGKCKRSISALVVPALPSAIQTPGLIDAADNLKRNSVKLADQYDSDTVTDIDVMIGGNYYSTFINGITTRNGIDLLKTSAGYVIYGSVCSNIPAGTMDVQLRRFTVADFTVFSEEPPIHKLWELDTIGIDASAPTPQDDAVYQNYLDTVKYENDRYETRLPWKTDHPPLPNNYKMAVGQLHALHRSLNTKPEMLNHYHTIIQEQLKQGFIEEVPNPKIHDACHYIPHHAVAKDSPTTPLRIVYNCSAKASKDVPSLNDCLMKGPTITEKLGDILVAFRTNEYAFTADISKAFLRIGLQEIDRDFTRFLWLEDPQNPRSRIITYRFASVLFGATSSPFLLQATLDFHLRNSSSPFKKLIREHFYVDNLVGALNSEDQLLEYYRDANCELKAANMPLREWASNSEELRLQIQNDQSGVKTDSVNLLGLQWNPRSDTMQLHPVQFDLTSKVPVTKRSLLSEVSKVFDPLGLFSPITIRGKILLQETWRLHVDWDTPLPQKFITNWEELARDMTQLSSIKIPRRTCCRDSCTSLVVFCDASTNAFGAAAYTISDQGSQLLMSKTRVAPLQTRTLPQLELTALQLGAQLAHTLCSNLKHITFKKVILFSDNEAALQWVRNDQCTMPYVRNRVHKIRELTSNKQILHVPSGDNPADLLTRGVTFKKFHAKKLDFWFKGPSWLMDEVQWPAQKQYVMVQELRTDVWKQPESVVTLPSPIDPDRFSTFDALCKTTEFVFKFLNFVYSPEEYWIKVIQRFEYPQVFSYLQQDHAEPSSLRVSLLGSPVKKFIKDLGLYIDDHGIIRSRGRLLHSLYHNKDQILLPPESRVTTLIILKVHRSVKHGGMSETLTQLRLQFWIPKGRLVVKKALKTCAHCRRIITFKIAHPGPPPLPQERVQFIRPFDTVGIDYTGAILIRDEATKEMVKVYICLFTCASSRAVHLELARDMSASTFLSLFRRFCARFSTPRLIITDNGTSFTASAKFLQSLFEEPTVKEYFTNLKISWKFIPPRAPWQGGFYERMVGIVKGCLQKTLFKKSVTWDELVTILMEVEQCVNNRPLTYVTSDLPDLVALTPNHLLKGEITSIMPPVSITDTLDPLYLEYDALKLNLHYSRLSEVIRKFADIWAKDYLIALKEKHFGNVPPHQAVSVKPGDIVLISSDQPRNRWPLGRITKIFPDADNVVRTVEVYSQGHNSIRTLDKLHALELAAEPEVLDLPLGTKHVKETKPELMRPKRRAAQRADDNRKLLISADQL